MLPFGAEDVGQFAGVRAEVLQASLFDQQVLAVVHQQVVAVALQGLTVLAPGQLGDG